MKNSQILLIASGLLIILGSFANFFEFHLGSFIFALGVALLIFSHSIHVFDKSIVDKREQRIARIGLMTSLMLAIAVYFMFIGSNSWVVMLLIYALSSFFLSFRTSKK